LITIVKHKLIFQLSTLPSRQWMPEWGRFSGCLSRDEQGFAELIGKESVTPAVDVEFPDMNGVGVGSGWVFTNRN